MSCLSEVLLDDSMILDLSSVNKGMANVGEYCLEPTLKSAEPDEISLC